MNPRILGLRVAGTIFALVGLAQLLRLTLQIEVVAGGHRVPFWPSAFILVLTGSLSIWLWKLSQPER